jgi:hypothetical protein
MRLYFLRHGAADWPTWNKPDDERPLTKAGGKELHKVGEFLARLKANPDLILTSPLPRAAETADIAAEHLLRQEFELAAGALRLLHDLLKLVEMAGQANHLLGDVAAFARGTDNSVTEMHLDIGGFLGFGETRVKLTPAQFKLQDDRVVLGLTAEQAKDLPKVQK